MQLDLKKNTALNIHSEHILLALQDKKLAQLIQQRLIYFNYSSSCADNHYQLQGHAQAFNPKLLIIDIDFQSKDMGLQLAERLAKKNLPIIFLSYIDTIERRILCAQHSGKAFLPLPLSIDLLFTYIHELTEKNSRNPYRILIIEDAAPQAFFIGSILKKAGMHCKIIQNPKILMQSLFNFNPELILLDLYFPDFSGFDLAKIIRQQNNHIALPIVFLSSEKNQQQQLQALKLGGDDFLTKPISPDYLFNTIHARVKRFRKMRYFIQHDSLTELLNHSAFLSELKLAQQKSFSTSSPLSFAMLDLDNFKQINDLHGHVIGDNVLKNLAYLLKKKLRSTDLIGRYGGEEFGIVLLNTNATNNYTVINHLRHTFANILHYSNTKQFFCTFSAGICTINPKATTKEIIALADQGLYQAKTKGKNRCVLINTNH